ncbi:beta-glucanase (GH16 family) [Flavobacterium sp. PL11]|jgi:beta-glucanase (GH16 family)|uniref:glycoside hydrolase family 16 protein n=1 Tax=Flavobacterium sp. PL11 TaxID=3071717 RepID=UPI002E05EB0A|nr:beta-glucanase (GH16 family) [Flavobacterium sp. PL11]
MTIKKRLLRGTQLIALLALALYSCSTIKTQNKESSSSKYKLIFNDNFNGNAYNSKFWSSYQTKNGKSPWNRYVIDDGNLAEVKNGHLHIKARWNTKTNLPETGAIQTKDKFSFMYGKIEVKAKFNAAGQGGWPAIWLMPQNEIYASWPNGGEIDIMERLNNDSFVHQVVHQSNGEKKQVSAATTAAINVTEYNTYGIVKSPNKIEFYVNDVLTMVHEPKGDFAKRWPFETDYYLILNFACADKGQSGVSFWPGNVTFTEKFPYEMMIDYVKVWEVK